MSLETRIDTLATYWANAPVFDEHTRNEVRELIERGDKAELTERFYRDLEFGTGGLRGILGAGSARMNIYNVRKASQAFANYIKESSPGEAHKLAVTYDSRRFSREFAEAVAGVMAANGIHAYVTKELRPVPMLSYMVRYYGCNGGVCVTASHNPPDYNGYKVYWRDGAQVVSPHDQAIINHYEAITDYQSIRFLPFDEAKTKGLITEVGDELDQSYFNQVKNLSLRSEGRDGFKIVYTPLHGSGLYPVTHCLKEYGFHDVLVVPEQRDPDGRFPTVKSPNPEDKEALRAALALAKSEKADLVLGTDPDCDRLGMIVKEGSDYRFFNGNQIGSLLIDYVLSGLTDAGRLPENPLVIKTIVTTDLQNAIGAHYGAHVDETLTGFKWICKVINEYETGIRTPYREYVCGGEESYGFLAGHFVRDKDGVIACCLAAEMTAYYKSLGKTLSQVLDEIFRRHGVYEEDLITLTLPGKNGAEKIASIMEGLRVNPPKEIDGVAVHKLRDLQAGTELTLEGDSYLKSGMIDLPASNVLQFLLSDGTKVSARPSGTEPKIKFYISIREPVSSDISDQALQATKKHCQTRVTNMRRVIQRFAE